MKNSIVVIGSANIDMVVKTDKFPKPGETLLGGKFFKFQGGKGANQAVAAARLGGKVIFICKVGDDNFGKSAIQAYRKEEINTDYIIVDRDHPTGVALISVNGLGENKIVVAPGANEQFTPQDIEAYSDLISTSEIVVIQLEIPLKTVGLILEIAKKNNTKVILNPAPAQQIPDSYLKDLYLITPNEIEVNRLTGVHINGESSLMTAADKFKNLGVKNSVITLGKKGAYLYSNEYKGLISSPSVEVEDTTAAGDVFNGALAVALTKKRGLKSAVQFACKAAAISVSKNGAQSSAPTIMDVQNFNKLAKNN